MEFSFGERLQRARKKLGLTQKQLGKPLKISGGYLSDVERDKKYPSEMILQLLEVHYNVSQLWLTTGQGEMFAGGGKSTQAPSSAAHQAAATTHPQPEQPQPDQTPIPVKERLSQTSAVLRSGSVYAQALDSNIVAFHTAITSNITTDILRQDLEDLRAEFKAMQQQQTAINQSHPPQTDLTGTDPGK